LNGFELCPESAPQHKPRPGWNNRANQFKSLLGENNVDPATTYQILSGRKKGRRGEAHRVAVLLGMKIGVTPGTESTLEMRPEQ
jgi:gp16 family phage-associated protein